jgi:hypothetical protein
LFTPTKKVIGWGVVAAAITLLAAAGLLAYRTLPLGTGPLFTGDSVTRTESGGAWNTGTLVSFGAPKIFGRE